MKVLVVKMSSMGDVIHCLPAVTDLVRQHPEAIIDWVVEEAFQDIPTQHTGVRKVIPVAIRRWRKRWAKSFNEIQMFRRSLAEEDYDVIIDAQGLVKSAIVARLAKGKISGFDKASIKEPISTLAYQHQFGVAREMHAIERQRLLFAKAFGYELETSIDYGMSEGLSGESKDVFFFHGTTWASKHWPDQYWIGLAKLLSETGYQVVLPHTNDEEERRAKEISAQVTNARLLPRGSLAALISNLGKSCGAVTVDTGPGHLAAAMNVPLAAVYGPTRAELTGIVGPRQISLAAPTLPCAPCLNRDCQYSRDSSKIHPPCFETITPEQVYETLIQQIAKAP